MINRAQLFMNIAASAATTPTCGGITNCDWTTNNSGLSEVLRRDSVYVGIIFLCGAALFARVLTRRRLCVLSGCGLAALSASRLLSDSAFGVVLILVALIVYGAVLTFAGWVLFRLSKRAVLILRRFSTSLHGYWIDMLSPPRR